MLKLMGFWRADKLKGFQLVSSSAAQGVATGSSSLLFTIILHFWGETTTCRHRKAHCNVSTSDCRCDQFKLECKTTESLLVDSSYIRELLDAHVVGLLRYLPPHFLQSRANVWMNLGRSWCAADRGQREQRRQSARVAQGRRHGGCKNTTTNVIPNERTVTKRREKKHNRFFFFFPVDCDAPIPDTGIGPSQSTGKYHCK